MLTKNEAYCLGCGKPRPKVPGYTDIDPRYLVVQCGRVKRAGTMDAVMARNVIKDRRARRKERKALLRATSNVEANMGLEP